MKRHKLNESEPDQCDEILSNEENEISDDKKCKLTEAKRPRKLRRSIKGSKPSVSRSRTSKRSSAKAKAVAAKSASRVTRSAAKDTTLDESTIFIESRSVYFLYVLDSCYTVFLYATRMNFCDVNLMKVV